MGFPHGDRNMSMLVPGLHLDGIVARFAIGIEPMAP